MNLISKNTLTIEIAIKYQEMFMGVASGLLDTTGNKIASMLRGIGDLEGISMAGMMRLSAVDPTRKNLRKRSWVSLASKSL